MALIDFAAADRIRELRRDLGLSPEALADEIKLASKDAPWGRRGTVDAHTIRRIERYGHVPGERVQFVISSYFGLRLDALWRPGASRARALAA